MRILLNNLNHRIIFPLFLFVFLASCSNAEMYYKYEAIPQATWNRTQLCHFDVSISDTTNLYDVFIEIRNDDEYAFRNLWLFVDYKTPEGHIRKDTLNCELADAFGKWYGKGLSLKTLILPFEQNVHFRQSGNYVYMIQHGMREDELKGISDIGLRIIKQTNQ